MRIINNNNEITKCDEKLDEKIEKIVNISQSSQNRTRNYHY